MGRSVIIPDYYFTPDNILKVVDGSGNEDCDYQASREMRAATPATANVGKLFPVPVGEPDAAVDRDVYVRIPGNTNGARWGQYTAGTDIFQGKTQASLPQDITFLAYDADTEDRMIRPKMLPLADGRLLLVYTTEALIGRIKWSVYTPSTNTWAAFQTINHTVAFDAKYLGMCDMVQLPDTGEIIMVLAGTDVDGAFRMERFVGDPDLGSNAWNSVPCFYDASSTTTAASYANIFSGGAIELLPSGRIALVGVMHGTAPKFIRSYSDDRGTTWAPFLRFDNANLSTYVTTTAVLGGVSMCRTSTNSLVATVGSGKWTNLAANELDPGLFAYVSDDGDNWAAMVRGHKMTASGTTNKDYPFGNIGQTEGAVVVGDDGLLHILGVHHGPDLTGTAYTPDCVTMVTTGKPDIGSKDAAPTLSDLFTFAGTAYFYTAGTNVFPQDTTFNPTYGATLSESHFYMRRAINVNSGDQAGTSNLDDDPTTYSPRGARYIEAVNYRGAIWLAISFQRGTAMHALGVMRCNQWSELDERPPLIDETLNYDGMTYRINYIPFDLPATADTAYTVTTASGGSHGLNATTGGWQVNPGAGSGTAYVSLAGKGISTTPAYAEYVLARFDVSIQAGGSTSASDIAFSMNWSDGTNYGGLTVQMATTGFRVVDNISVASLGSVTFGSSKTRIVMVIRGLNTVAGTPTIYYKAYSAGENLEDLAWTAFTPTGPVTETVGTTQNVQFGCLTTAAATSTWHQVMYVRNDTDFDPRLQAYSGGYAWNASPPDFTEFLNTDIAYDDGLHHGTRALLCSPSPAYLQDNAYVQWRGAAGVMGDNFNIASDFAFDREYMLQDPVSNYWRSNDDNQECNIVFDAGSLGKFAPEYIALFGVNFLEFKVQLNATDSWGSPSVDIDVNIPVPIPDVARPYWWLSATQTTLTASNAIAIYANSSSSSPLMTPHQFKSTNRVSWYMYSDKNSQTYKIIDNDAGRLIFDQSITGAVTADANLYFFPDKIAFKVLGDEYTGAGYRYMRIHIPVQPTAEGYFKLGLIIAGKKYDLTNPHPDWGWTVSRVPATARTDTRAGYVRSTKIGDAKEIWRFGFVGTRGMPDRSGPLADPGYRGGFDSLIAMLEGTNWGEKVVALLPEYNDNIEDGDEVTFGHKTHDVIPARVLGNFEGTHQAYECGRTGDELYKDILDVDAFEFHEVL